MRGFVLINFNEWLFKCSLSFLLLSPLSFAMEAKPPKPICEYTGPELYKFLNADSPGNVWKQIKNHVENGDSKGLFAAIEGWLQPGYLYKTSDDNIYSSIKLSNRRSSIMVVHQAFNITTEIHLLKEGHMLGFNIYPNRLFILKEKNAMDLIIVTLMACRLS